MNVNPYQPPATDAPAVARRFPFFSTLFNAVAAISPFVAGSVLRGLPSRPDRVLAAIIVFLLIPWLLAFLMTILGGIFSKGSGRQRFYLLLLVCNVIVGILLLGLSVALIGDGLIRLSTQHP